MADSSVPTLLVPGVLLTFPFFATVVDIAGVRPLVTPCVSILPVTGVYTFFSLTWHRALIPNLDAVVSPPTVTDATASRKTPFATFDSNSSRSTDTRDVKSRFSRGSALLVCSLEAMSFFCGVGTKDGGVRGLTSVFEVVRCFVVSLRRLICFADVRVGR